MSRMVYVRREKILLCHRTIFIVLKFGMTENLVTNRPRYAMRATDGTIIEVFEWSSPEAIERAHHTPSVLALWTEFDAVCDYVPLSSLPESLHPFSEFQPLPV